MKLLTIIKKNFRIFTRSKVSALIIFLGPLLLVSLIGMSFSNMQLPGLSVAVFSPNYNDFSNSIIQKIEENKFTIQKFDSNKTCSDSVKKGDSAICLLFPENMDKANNEVTFVVDYSKINLVWIVVDIFSSRVSERATELRQSYADDLLSRVMSTKEDISKQKSDAALLSSKQSDSKSSLENAKSVLDQIDVSLDFGDFIEASNATASLSSVTSKVNSAKSRISSAKSAVSGSSLSDDEKTAITNDLSSASSSLSSALIYLQGNDSVNSLEYLISSLGSALENAKTKLDAIDKKRNSALGDMITVSSSLDDSIKSADSIKSLLESMASRLENVQSSDAEQIVSPIRTKIEPVTAQETHFNYLFPTLIVLIIMITAVLLSSTLVMNEKKSKSMFRNFITPTADWIFNVGTFLTALIAILIQLIVFLAISSLFFGTSIANIGASSLILLLVTSAFILLGMLIGFLFKSEETYVLAAITVSALLMFLSSTILPIESISDSIRIFASYTPFVVSEALLRQSMFFNFGLNSLESEMLILTAYIIVFYGAIVLVHKLARYKISIKKENKK